MSAAEGERSDDDEHELLARLLDLSPEAAFLVRLETPARQRPRRQVGPSADYGRNDSG